MIGILKHLFRKKQEPLEMIKSHKSIFEGSINASLKDGNYHTKKERNIHLRMASKEDYLNRILNSEFNTNIFDFHLHCKIKPDTNICNIEIKPNNLKSELVLLGYKYKDFKKLKKNFKHHTYIIKDKSISIGKTKIYSLYGTIGSNEIYILKGHENGI